MANFPNAVTSFTTRNPGDQIPSADWNTFGQEINAIEDGYINGTARLNSSASTLASLSVTGGSTLNTLNMTGGLTVASLNVSGVSTLVGNVSIGGIYTAPTQPRVSVFSSVVTQISSGSTTVVTFESEQYDVGSFHSTSANTSRLTVPAGSSGLYVCVGQVYARTNASAPDYQLAILKNSSQKIAVEHLLSSLASGSIQVHGVLQLDAADIVELAVIAPSGGSTLSIGITTFPQYGNRLTMAKIA